MKFFKLRRKKYTSYEDGSASIHPRVEQQTPAEWRYEGIGMMADDGIDDFLEEPDQVGDDMLTALLGVEADAGDAFEEAVATDEAPVPLDANREASDEGRNVSDANEEASVEGAPCEPSAAACISNVSDPEIVEPDYVQDRKTEKRDASRISYVYESRDGGLCGFEDEAGHIVAVNARRLA